MVSYFVTVIFPITISIRGSDGSPNEIANEVSHTVSNTSSPNQTTTLWRWRTNKVSDYFEAFVIPKRSSVCFTEYFAFHFTQHCARR
jgi:hypothetical protein